MEKMTRFVTRGPKVGKCNICGEFGKLTEDHTPPKGAARITRVQVNTLTEILHVEKPTKTSRISQNGVKFRSLCKGCNNNYLGSNYDVAFTSFSQDVKKLLTTSVNLPNVLHVEGKPQKIARALYGHLLAVGVDDYYETDKSLHMKRWFFDETEEMPDFFNIYYWPYPYQKQILIKNAIYRDTRITGQANIWLMKFFPVAFLIMWDNPVQYQHPELANFDKWKKAVDDVEIAMPIRLKNIPDESWPEVPVKTSFLAYNGNLAIGAAELKK